MIPDFGHRIRVAGNLPSPEVLSTYRQSERLRSRLAAPFEVACHSLAVVKLVWVLRAVDGDFIGILGVGSINVLDGCLILGVSHSLRRKGQSVV